jgi:hypothetical protein
MRMRSIPLPAALAALVLLLAGCGGHNVIVKVDILSFMDPSSRQQSFGPIPAAPGGLASGETRLLDQNFNLVQGLSDAVNIQSVSVDVGGTVNTFTGSGEDTVRVYLSDPATDPLTTPPVIVQALALTSGTVTPLTATLADDPRVNGLFAARQIRVGVTFSLRGPASGAALTGQLSLTKLVGIIVAGQRAY